MVPVARAEYQLHSCDDQYQGKQQADHPDRIHPAPQVTARRPAHTGGHGQGPCQGRNAPPPCQVSQDSEARINQDEKGCNGRRIQGIGPSAQQDQGSEENPPSRARQSRQETDAGAGPQGNG